ncbi:Fic family protein [Candidatus Poriferisodalis sp.]|uniref:Fic family protein n=1 Tax=Candidatus Poriferisodalis sp. TaxID=3101277 RepID=UPI003AF73028
MALSASLPWPRGVRTVFFDDDHGVASAPTLRRAVVDGHLRRLATRLYTSDVKSDPAEVVAHNIWRILDRMIPDAVIVDRSAAEDGKVISGVLYVATDQRHTVLRLPGVEVRVRPHPAGLDVADELPWPHGLRMSRPARILVDNLAPSRGRGVRASRTLSLAELEDWVARKASYMNRTRVLRLRDEAIELANHMGVADRIHDLDALFKRLDGREPLPPDSGRLFSALVQGGAWDERRVEMFTVLAAGLTSHDDPDLPQHLPAGSYNNELPFFESYFSNYIEGTVFLVEEARRIIETQQPPASRPADGHDILGTYRCVADTVGRRAVSEDPSESLFLLRERHASILEGRPELGPGEWKHVNNRAGSHHFVEPHLVEGTLLKGLELTPSVPSGFRRALYMMMMVSEVHPFTDGNGRVARVMMNAELSAVNQTRIVIPTVFRNEYIGAVKRTSASQALNLSSFVRVMSFAWRWTAAMPWDDKAATEGQLVATDALSEPDDAAIGGIKLRLP